MKLEFKTSVVRERIQLRPCEMGTKVNVRTCGYDITLCITKTRIDKNYKKKAPPVGRTVGAATRISSFSVKVRTIGVEKNSWFIEDAFA